MTVPKTIVGLGEVLWDVFPDGARFGGAPANFACSVAGVGGDAVHVCMVSAVGNDELGQRALLELKQRHVDVSFVSQQDRPTGQVLVRLNAEGQASYEYAADTAWDNVAWSDGLQSLAASVDAVCFGSLGQRSDVSRKTIRRFVAATPESCLRILDINLRPPFWNDKTILESLPLANVLKLNSDELPVVASLLNLHGNEQELLRQLQQKFSLRLVALTRGADGSLLLDQSGEFSNLPGQLTQVVDTVGAGDAFTAGMAVGLLKKLTLPDVHLLAARVAAYVCTQPGATPVIPVQFSASLVK